MFLRKFLQATKFESFREMAEMGVIMTGPLVIATTVAFQLDTPTTGEAKDSSSDNPT